MPDISVTIGSTTRNFDLVRAEQGKLWRIQEQPITIPKSPSDQISSPSYENLPPEFFLAFTQRRWRGGMGQLIKPSYPDMFSNGSAIDSREPNQLFLGPLVTAMSQYLGAIKQFEFFNDREYALSPSQLWKLSADKTTWVSVLDCLIEDCEDAWNEITVSGVTSETDTSDRKVGAASAKLTIADSVAADTLVAAEARASLDLTSYTTIKLWIKSNVTAASGDLKLLLDNHAQCVSPEESIDIPALVANTWTEVTLTLANPASDTAIISVGLKYITDLGACIIRLDEIRYDTMECISIYDTRIYTGFTLGNYQYSSTGESASWTVSNASNAIAHLFSTAAPLSGTKDMMVLGKRPNELRTSSNPINGGTAWDTTPYYIGDTNSDITGLFNINDKLFIGKEDGIYELETSGRVIPLLPELRTKISTENFKWWSIWQTSLYASVAGDIMEVTTNYSVDYVGPLERSPSLGVIGSVKAISSDDKNIYVCILVGSNYNIYIGRERTDDDYGRRWEWCPYIALSTNTCNSMKVMQRDGENPRLWYSYQQQAAYSILSRSPNYPIGDSNYRFTTQGYLESSYFDYNYDTWLKLFYQLWIACEGSMSATVNIKVYYRKDTQSSYTLLATITSAGITSTNLTAISCKKIQLKIELNSDDSTKTPILNMFLLLGVLQPATIQLIDFTVALDISQSKKVSQDLTFLEGGRTATAHITIKDNRFQTTRYVSFLPGSPAEIELVDVPSKQPSYGARIQAIVWSWSPP